ncbi:hypothetical protein LA080_013981 [Diaporthe eres]|nr:hypothetical protein LA080_013981 [Diaporthe eres]
MAELLGLVASGLSVAQIAGSIVITSLKVKTLLDEVKDAPQSLGYMLGHIELLTNILCEETSSDDQGASANPPLLPATSHLQQAMQKALTQCQAAGKQLEILATDLKSQIDAARGGVRKKRAMFKVVLKKAMLAEHEARLQKTVQLLTLVQGAYMLALQRAQPEMIVSQLMSALTQSPPSAHGPAMIPHDQSQDQIHSPHTMTGRRQSTRHNTSALHECWRLGFAKVTGLVRIHTTSRAKDDPINNSTRERTLRIQVQIPAWLCASGLDAVFSQSYAGWDWSLNMYGYLRHGSVEFNLVMDAIHGDDVDAMHRLFQERRCGPLDWIVWNDDSDPLELSMLTYALAVGFWEVSGYLLNYGAPQPKTFKDIAIQRE